jgi:hypothetical protein
VQLDEALVGQLDEAARRRGTNRSALLREGARTVLAAEAEAAADRKLIESYRRLPQDPDLVDGAGNLAARTGPAW